MNKLNLTGFQTVCTIGLLLLFTVTAVARTERSSDSWQERFESLLNELTAKEQAEEKITRQELYRLGRYFIRNELERKCLRIEAEELDTESLVIILKGVYAFFDFSNPVGRELSDDVPGFDAELPDSEALLERWRTLYTNALENDQAIFDFGDQLRGDQIYELGRAMFLYFLHNSVPPFEYISDDQWHVLRSALHVICYLNVPGGFNPGYAPDFPVKLKELKRKKSNWSKVEKYLRENAARMGFGDGIVLFLVGSPRSWAAFEKRISGTKWKITTRNLATYANALITKAAAAYTDNSNQEPGITQDQLFSNYISPDEYATMIPPAVRIRIIENLGESNEMSPDMIVAYMVDGFMKYGRKFSLDGWSGIAEDYGCHHTLAEFQDFLIGEKVLLTKADLGSDAELKLQDIIDTGTGEKTLGEYFTANSVFALF